MSRCDWCEDGICLCAPGDDPVSQLACLMSELSEECYCAGWLIGTEHVLWDLAHAGGGKWGVDAVTPEQAAELLRLSTEARGWIAWRDGKGAVFAPMAEWIAEHAGFREGNEE